MSWPGSRTRGRSHKIPGDMRSSGHLGLDLTAGNVSVLGEEKESDMGLAHGWAIGCAPLPRPQPQLSSVASAHQTTLDRC